MVKKRSRRQRQARKTNYSFRYLYEGAGSESASVKGEFKYSPKKFVSEAKKVKRANFTADSLTFKDIKQDIVKSLMLAIFLISLELVLYFTWR